MITLIDKVWDHGTCVILGGGPSVTKQLEETDFWKKIFPSLSGVITINDSWRLIPKEVYFARTVYMDHIQNYFCDHDWWYRQQSVNLRSLDNTFNFHDLIYKGNWYTCSPDYIYHPQVKFLRLTGENGLETNPKALRHGHNSGYQSINLAFHAGVKKIILLGYEMKISGGRSHWHNDHRHSNNTFGMELERTMLPHFETLVDPMREYNVTVINATPDTALTCFPQMSLTEAMTYGVS